MSLAAPPDHLHSLSGLEGRRSTRIDRTVPLVVLGQTKNGNVLSGKRLRRSASIFMAAAIRRAMNIPSARRSAYGCSSPMVRRSLP